MSLVNDALKRAKAAQKNAPPASAPPLKPLEPARTPVRRGPGLLAPVLIFVSVSALAAFLWIASQRNEPARAPEPVAAAPASAPVQPVPAPAIAPSPEPATVASAATAAAGPPKPAPLKLQAIFFHPTRPSAMIAGHSVRVGAQVGGFRVATIDPASVTLISATQTNVLTLAAE